MCYSSDLFNKKKNDRQLSPKSTMAPMAIQPLLWNQKSSATLLFPKAMVQLHRGRTTRAFHNSGTPQARSLHGNGNLNGNLRRLCNQGRLKEAMEILHIMNQRCIPPDSSTYASLLQVCLQAKALPEGESVHGHMINTGFNPDSSVETKLVLLYAKCGSLVAARRALCQMQDQNVVSWTAVIAGYSRYGLDEEALWTYGQMQGTGIQPNEFTFASVLPACANLEALELGKEVHEDIIRSGLQGDIVLGNALMDMYSKCRRIQDARQVFDTMPKRNVVSWTTMIAGYARNGLVGEAMKLFKKMPERNVVSWNAILGGCVRNGLVEDALELFDKIPEQNVVSWNTMIAGCAQNGRFDEALNLFEQMQMAGVKPNFVTYASILPACANLAALGHGKAIHEEISRSGFESDIFVGNSLVDMYAKCGSLEYACHVFDKMPKRDVVSWSAMIAGYAQNGHVDEALTLFQKMPERNEVSWNTMISGHTQNWYCNEALKLLGQMRLTGVEPDLATFGSVLPACGNLADLKLGKEVHAGIIRRGFQSDMLVGNALVDMYAKCGSIENAQQVFNKMPKQNVISWTALIAGYALDGFVDETLKLFQKMPQRNVVSWNAVIAGYAQNGHVDEVQELFKKMPEPNVVSWNTMIGGYAQNGDFNQALKVFQQMLVTDVKPNSVTFASVLPACANLAALENGKKIHEGIIKSGFQFDIFVDNALVDMYAKCGSIQDALQVFKKMPEQSVVSWTAMIVGYAMHGYGKEALQLFEQMQLSSAMPNHVTFIGVLSACCHAGLLDNGWKYFHCMNQNYHITPAVEHYCCMVDLLGRAGLLDEAHDFINKMPIKPNASVWGCLLGACSIHTNLELGEHAAGCLFEMDPENATYYVLLSNIYAATGRWADVDRVRKMMNDRKVKKRPGCSWIEINNKVYSFLVGDNSHPQMDKIYAELEKLFGQMKEAGYMPNSNFVLHDVEEEQKEHILCYHSEKLALAFGLMHTFPGTPIRIVKNLRVCGDCHSATKFISNIIAREIVVRDANRFHHFKGGQCSCGDYW